MTNPRQDVAQPPDFLAHRPTDLVAVAVRDLSAGPVRGVAIDGDEDLSAVLRESISLGHKFALTDIPSDTDVIEYGAVIGRATTAITAGSHVHTHNLRSARWPKLAEG